MAVILIALGLIITGIDKWYVLDIAYPAFHVAGAVGKHELSPSIQLYTTGSFAGCSWMSSFADWCIDVSEEEQRVYCGDRPYTYRDGIKHSFAVYRFYRTGTEACYLDPGCILWVCGGGTFDGIFYLVLHRRCDG